MLEITFQYPGEKIRTSKCRITSIDLVADNIRAFGGTILKIRYISE